MMDELVTHRRRVLLWGGGGSPLVMQLSNRTKPSRSDHP